VTWVFLVLAVLCALAAWLGWGDPYHHHEARGYIALSGVAVLVATLSAKGCIP
jgi:hypothetical protein